MSLYHDEYVAHAFGALIGKQVFLWRRYFVQLIDPASNAPAHYGRRGSLREVHRIPLVHQSVALFRPRYPRPTPLALSAKLELEDRLPQLPELHASAHILQNWSNQLPCRLYLDIEVTLRKIHHRNHRAQHVLNQLRQL